MIEQFTETKLTIMLVAMNLALMDNWIETNAIITFVELDVYNKSL